MSEVENNPKNDETAGVTIDPVMLQRLEKKIRENQNIMKGALAGLVASVIGAGIWAAITVITNYQIGWMVVGVGFLVGYAVRLFGKGYDKIFGIAGSGLSLLGCLLGNLLTVIVVVSRSQNVAVMQLVSGLDPGIILNIMIETFNPMDALFYGLAIYEGFRFSINTIPEEELQKLVVQK